MQIRTVRRSGPIRKIRVPIYYHMTNLILLFVCLLLGVILQRLKGFPKEGHLVLNAIIIYVCLPALTLLYTTEIHFERSQILPILMPYLLFGFAFAFFNIADIYCIYLIYFDLFLFLFVISYFFTNLLIPISLLFLLSFQC